MTTSAIYQDVTDDQLIESYALAAESAKAAREQMDRIAFELEQRMKDRGATAIAHPAYEVRLETPSTLDAEALRPVAELIPPDEWARGFVEAHDETVRVPARADLRVIRGWYKYGFEIAAKIEAAKVPGLPRLSIKAKK